MSEIVVSRRIFIAGANGATGRTLLSLQKAQEADLVPHYRPKSAQGKTLHPQAAVLDLTDAQALETAMQGCTTVMQLIGTMRKRFSTGDTYETSDIDTTQYLVDAAKRCGVDHVVLLSSVGAGNPTGAYLKAKAKAEAIVTESGLDYTIFRPSAFHGAGHRAPPGMRFLMGALGMHRFRPILIEELAASLLHVAQTETFKGQVLEGLSLWDVVAAS